MNRTNIEQIAHKLQRNESLDEHERGLTAQILMLVGQSLYETSGSMFIAGFSGDIESDGLPKDLLVCPTFGSDICESYIKRE